MGSPANECQHRRKTLKGPPILAFVYTNVYYMIFEWDPLKSDANLCDRGFDFEFAVLVFEGILLQKEDRRKAYGELRMVAIGVVEGVHLTVVYTDRLGLRLGLIERWGSRP